MVKNVCVLSCMLLVALFGAPAMWAPLEFVDVGAEHTQAPDEMGERDTQEHDGQEVDNARHLQAGGDSSMTGSGSGTVSSGSSTGSSEGLREFTTVTSGTESHDASSHVDSASQEVTTDSALGQGMTMVDGGGSGALTSQERNSVTQKLGALEGALPHLNKQEVLDAVGDLKGAQTAQEARAGTQKVAEKLIEGLPSSVNAVERGQILEKVKDKLASDELDPDSDEYVNALTDALSSSGGIDIGAIAEAIFEILGAILGFLAAVAKFVG